jgi:hypothetical protein
MPTANNDEIKLVCDGMRTMTKPLKSPNKALKLRSRTAVTLPTLLVLLLLACLTGCGVLSSNGEGPSQNAQVILPISPVAQETPDWCWLASGQMIFQYFQIPPVNPNYQCGIIGAFEGPQSECFYDCAVCDFGGGSAQNVALMLQYYSAYATDETEELSFLFVPSALTFQQIQTEIAANRPILTGINVGNAVTFGNSGHLVVIVGYDAQSSLQNVVVNDPFPYATAGYPDPYLAAGAQQPQAGQYSIAYSTFVQSFAWNTTYYDLTLDPISALDRQKDRAHFGSKWTERQMRTLGP